MKKIILNKISIDLISFIFLLIWCLSPIITMFFQSIKCDTTFFLKLLIYIIGYYGFLIYVLNKLKTLKEKKYSLKQIVKHDIPFFLILILILWAIISTIFSDNIILAIFGESYRNEGLIVYIAYAGFIFLASTITNKKHITYIFKSIILSSIIISTISILTNNFNSSIFFNSNHYGYYLLISTMLALFKFINEKVKINYILYLIIYFSLCFFLIKNDTFGCYLAFLLTITALFIYSIIKKYERKNIIIAIIIFIILSLLITNSSGENIANKNFKSFINDIKIILNNNYNNELEKKEIQNIGSSRGNLWINTIKIIKKHPIVGCGIENLKINYQKDKVKMYRPHNMILQFAGFIGIPGAIIYLIFIFYISIINFKKITKEKNTIIITAFFTAISYFISSIFGNSMFYTSPYFMILIGILTFYSKKEKYIFYK